MRIDKLTTKFQEALGDAQSLALELGPRYLPLITPTAVVHHTPEWVGRKEHSIHMAHVSSVAIDMSSVTPSKTVSTHSPDSWSSTLVTSAG